MPIGRKLGSLKHLKDQLKTGDYLIKLIPKEGSITVRFLEEPENWVNYIEHYDQTMKKAYPCIEQSTCPGCATDERRSSRYLANAVDVATDKVVAIQLPKDLVGRLVNRYEKYDTMMDRDYELSRTGAGLDTTYDCEAEPVMKRKLDKYQLRDLTELLDEVYQQVFGGTDDEEDDDPKPVRKRTPSKSAPASTAKRRTKFAVEEEDEDEDEELDDEELDEDEAEEEEAESEDEEEEAEDEEEGEFYTEEELTAMSLGELRALAKEYGISTTGLKKADLVEAILGDAEEEEDEEPF